jgi:hypothetical protein
MRIRGRERPVRVTFSAHARSPLRLQPRGAIARESEVPHALTAREREVLGALLVRPFTGRDELLQQVETARAVSGCDCGCPTISLLVDEHLPPAPVKHEPEPLIGYVDDANGHHEISIVVRDGFLRQLELVTYDEKPVLEWPDLTAMRLMVFEEPTWSDGT